MNETKMLTLLEAWKRVPLKHTIGVEDSFAHGFAAGREGVIPADRAVETGEIDRGGNALNEAGWAFIKAWNDMKIGPMPNNLWNNCKQGICYPVVKAYLNTAFPVATPAWTPKIGEAVFVHYNPTQVGRIEKVKEGEAPFVVLVEGQLNDIYTHAMLKPFSESAIGKPWSEI